MCLFRYDDPCVIFPTLFFDVFVDCFFMVRALARECVRAL